MDKPSFKLVGSPCGQQGQYTFYKGLRITGKKEKVIAIGDFFFVRIWQDSELVSIGELQLLWTDRVSEQTLVSLRLYFLPENTPDGRGSHGEDEVLALNEKVVVRASDLVSWMCTGESWRCGVRAVWRGACAPPAKGGPDGGSDLHANKRDFSDVYSEQNAIETDTDSPGVVVFSYPRYCRYRALMARLEGMQSAWLRDSLVAALGGYAGCTTNTTILYCKDTFEYPELEGHEFVCNHLLPRLKGRGRGRRKRLPSRSPPGSPQRANNTVQENHKVSPRRLSLRNGSSEKPASPTQIEDTPTDLQFLERLQEHYTAKGEPTTHLHPLKDLSLRALYEGVTTLGGYSAVCRERLWRRVHARRPARAKDVYSRYLRSFEEHERSKGRLKVNGTIEQSDPPDTIHVPDSPPPPDTGPLKCKEDEKSSAGTCNADELNRQFLESISQQDNKPVITVKPQHALYSPDKQKNSVIKLFEENSGLVAELSAKYNVADSKVIEEVGVKKLSDGSSMLLGELARRLQLDGAHPSVLSSLPAAPLANGHTHTHTEQKARPVGRSSLRAVRVKPGRPASTAGNITNLSCSQPKADSPPQPPASAPPITNFGIHHPPQPPPPPPHTPANSASARGSHSDDEIVEVPYKPKTPEIIDLDEYPESPQSTKKKKLDILKERGLEVTAIPPSAITLAPVINPPLMLNPAMQHQIMTQASLFQMYNIIPQNYANGIQPPKVIQSSCLYGTSTPEKTVYGNPKDPFMPPPHVLLGTPIKPQKCVTTEKSDTPTRQDILDLTCKSSTQKPAVEIVRIPNVPSPSKSAQNLSKNYTLIDGKAVVGSNLEITLVNPKSQTPPKNKQPQKRSSNGKFMSTKTPIITPPKDYPKNFTSPSAALSPTMKKNPISIPTYQMTKEEISPTTSTGSRDSQQNYQNNIIQNVFKGQNSLAQIMDLQKGQLGPNLGQNLSQIMDMQKSVPLSPFVDPMYMSALYSSIAGQMDQRQLAMYRDLMANQFRYSGLIGGVATPTTKN